MIVENYSFDDIKTIFGQFKNVFEVESDIIIFFSPAKTFVTKANYSLVSNVIEKYDYISVGAEGKTVVVVPNDVFGLLLIHHNKKQVALYALRDLLVDYGVAPEIIEIVKEQDLEINHQKVMGIVRSHTDSLTKELGMVTFNVNEEIFREILPDEEFFRTATEGHQDRGIGGIRNYIQNLNKNEFLMNFENKINERIK